MTVRLLEYKREGGENGQDKGSSRGDFAPTEGDAPLGDAGEGEAQDEKDAVCENEGANDVTHEENQR